MSRKTILAPVALLLTAASLVLLWFVILSGVTRTSPLRQTYFLRADTSGYEGARAVSQWTYFHVCGNDNTDCGPARPALPLGDAWASNARNVPAELVGNHGNDTTGTYYWYMWRFGWVFFLIALFFEVVAFFSGFLALCSRLGSAFTGLLSTVALFFLTIAVSLMTVTFVKVRNVIIADGRDATLGRYGFGFSWGAWFALFIATILFCAGRHKRRDPVAPTGTAAAATATTPAADRSRRTWPWTRRSASRRGYDGRRVKEEYA
ncbi:SUR7/PalI family-domain-containing protein [Dichotomopilus funicola]|uniref:SUR7/PalI family-domain-containing protein n=1 Tax=Dichotomopilus funicola TaxID=1934379 RepID=A0AAN6V5U8_9PEZI|nr:SUR7/PalI family-domain-containing protein [Dichotomopilus funicola]